MITGVIAARFTGDDATHKIITAMVTIPVVMLVVYVLITILA